MERSDGSTFYKTLMNQLLIQDPLYGKQEITSPVVLEIIASETFHRLKGISQYGIPDEFYHLQNFYRYEHCIGTYLLLKKFGASETEQIAGLIHDISHTAFSHTVDWVLQDARHTEDFQDEQHETYIAKSPVAKILEKHGYTVSRVANYDTFGLLERDLPDLCADRIDYSLREEPNEEARDILASLRVVDGQFVMKDQASARVFAERYLRIQTEHWGGFEAVSRYKLFSRILRRGLEQKVFVFDDFWKVDETIVELLKKSNDAQILQGLEILRNKNLSGLPKSKEPAFKKFRHIDPKFLENGKLVRLSSIDPEWANKLEAARKENEQGVFIAEFPFSLK